MWVDGLVGLRLSELGAVFAGERRGREFTSWKIKTSFPGLRRGSWLTLVHLEGIQS